VKGKGGRKKCLKKDQAKYSIHKRQYNLGVCFWVLGWVLALGDWGVGGAVGGFLGLRWEEGGDSVGGWGWFFWGCFLDFLGGGCGVGLGFVWGGFVGGGGGVLGGRVVGGGVGGVFVVFWWGAL